MVLHTHRPGHVRTWVGDNVVGLALGLAVGMAVGA